MAQSQRRFSDAQEREIAARYRDGETMAQLVADYPCDVGTIRNVLRRQGVPRRRKGPGQKQFSPEQIREITADWQSGKSQEAVARRFHTSQTAVSRLLRAQGIEPEKRIRPDPPHASGTLNGNWKGGRVVSKQGYVWVLMSPVHPWAPFMRANHGYVLEHRLKMAEAIGRPLERYETVHHINGDTSDNRLENLELRNGRHGKGVVLVCGDCGSQNVTATKLAAISGVD